MSAAETELMVPASSFWPSLTPGVPPHLVTAEARQASSFGGPEFT